jgi:PTH1 family peptidyl-tRNA hydrolase
MGIRCIVGLGNPGPKYEWTRHNAGFWVVNRMAQDSSLAWKRIGSASEAEGSMHGADLVLMRPMAFMNRSGGPVLATMERRGLMPSEVLVVVDDVALPEGKIRLRKSGGAGGHRGLESIEESLGTKEYPRLRIGVGGAPEGEDLADYVLRAIPAADRDRFEEIVTRAADAVGAVVELGVPLAMNRVNVGGEVDPTGRAPSESASRGPSPRSGDGVQV